MVHVAVLKTEHFVMIICVSVSSHIMWKTQVLWSEV